MLEKDHCDACGNFYKDLIEIRLSKNGQSHYFDCFECAIHKLAPMCHHCGIKVIGHGAQVGDITYCGAHCARASGNFDVVDHTEDLTMTP